MGDYGRAKHHEGNRCRQFLSRHVRRNADVQRGRRCQLPASGASRRCGSSRQMPTRAPRQLPQHDDVNNASLKVGLVRFGFALGSLFFHNIFHAGRQTGACRRAQSAAA